MHEIEEYDVGVNMMDYGSMIVSNDGKTRLNKFLSRFTLLYVLSLVISLCLMLSITVQIFK